MEAVRALDMIGGGIRGNVPDEDQSSDFFLPRNLARMATRKRRPAPPPRKSGRLDSGSGSETGLGSATVAGEGAGLGASVLAGAGLGAGVGAAGTAPEAGSGLAAGVTAAAEVPGMVAEEALRAAFSAASLASAAIFLTNVSFG